MKIFFRKLHRWLGLLMAVQIIAWMASGLYFSLVPITEIRGEHLTRPTENLNSTQLRSLPTPETIHELLDQQFDPGWSLSSLGLIAVGDEAYWRVAGTSGGAAFTRLVSADGKRFVPRLSGEEAQSRAQSWLLAPAEAASVEWVEQTGSGSEIRGRSLPVWKVSFLQPESLSLYLDPWTGEILARRTDRWRIFDFLWMLHIMDFNEREDFNHPLLQIAAALGLVIALGGVVLWALTTKIFRRNKRRFVTNPG